MSSERIALLGWPSEVFYRRLMSVVDDFGRYEGNPKLLRAALYPLLIDKVSDSDIGKWLTECVNAGLVSVYEARAEAADRKGSHACIDGVGEPADGSGGPLKRYLQLHDFRQQVRAEKSKYPQMPDVCAADATQLPSTRASPAHVFGDVVVDGDGDGDEEKRTRKRAPPLRCPEDVPEAVWRDWCALRKAKRAPVTETALEAARAEASKAGLTIEAFLRVWCARGSQGLEASWLKPGESRGATVRTFRQQDADDASARVAEMTGGLVNAKPTTRRIFDQPDTITEVRNAPARLE